MLRGFGLVGSLFFVSLFLLTFSASHMVEKSAKSFIESKLQNEITEKIDAIKLPQSKTLEKVLGNKAQDVYQKSDEKSTEFKQKLKDGLPAIMATQMEKVTDPSCECRTKWKERLNASLQFEVTTLEKAREKLVDMIHGKYMETVGKLTRDIRIFFGLNALLFINVVLLSFLKPEATEHLFFPSLLMLLSSGICSYFYLFKQNWFYTILYNDYIGFGYLAYVVVVFALLCDIVFNKAKVTTKIINFFAHAIGSSFSLTSC